MIDAAEAATAAPPVKTSIKSVSCSQMASNGKTVVTEAPADVEMTDVSNKRANGSSGSSSSSSSSSSFSSSSSATAAAAAAAEAAGAAAGEAAGADGVEEGARMKKLRMALSKALEKVEDSARYCCVSLNQQLTLSFDLSMSFTLVAIASLS